MIDRFDDVENESGGKYAFLSNFYPVEVEYDGLTYPSSEAAYQAAKSGDPRIREVFTHITDPAVAKKLGRMIDGVRHWDSIKERVMREIVWNKFVANHELRAALLATGNEELVEGNTWHDNFWGDCKCGFRIKRCKPACRQPGLNILGKILMDVRAQLDEDVRL